MTDEDEKPGPFISAVPPVQPVRANRKLVYAGIAAGAVSLAALLSWSWVGDGKKSVPLPPEPKPSEQAMPWNFPHDYAAATAPAAAAAPAANHPAPAAGADNRPPPSTPPVGAIKPPGPMSPLFAPGGTGPGALRAMQEAETQTGRGGSGDRGEGQGYAGEQRPGMDDGNGNQLDVDQRQGLAAQKNTWLARAGTGVAGNERVTQPMLGAMPYQIQAGTVINAALLTQINTDLPGDVVALITTDVFDSATGQWLLIPAGSRLYGLYGNQMSYGQTRAQIAWSRILFRNGTSQTIGAMVGTDASGSAGVEGDVDHHSLAMTGAIGLSALLSVVGQAGQLFSPQGDGGQTNIGLIGANGAAQTGQGIGQAVVQKELARPNTLVIPQGYQVSVLVSKDMSLAPYHE